MPEPIRRTLAVGSSKIRQNSLKKASRCTDEYVHPLFDRTALMITHQRIALVLSSALIATGVAHTSVSAAPTPLPADVPAPPVIDTSRDDPWIFPVKPPVCDEEQLAMGDVRACVVMGWNDPTSRGWLTPPAPRSGESEQWRWNGYSYSGSPALADWEDLMSANDERIDRVGVGRLMTNAGVSALFEGFLTEVVAGGYRLYDAHGYGFRCTAGSGGWDCPSGDPSGLSLHAWGLAIDINAGTNPIVTLRDPDGGNACEVPMETDMPQWVIQTAEKWGLYWGGYGFSSDCSSPDDVRQSSFRDPPHFEFRGTPEVADRIARFNLRNNPELGCYDVIDPDGTERLRCNREFTVEPGWRVAIDPDAPDGAVAAVVNLTATGADAWGYLSLVSCGPMETEVPETSNVNYDVGQDVANVALVELDADGRFCVYHYTEVHAVIDVVGFIMAPGADANPGWFTPVQPVRLRDTRREPVCRTDQSCSTGPIEAGEVASIPLENSLTVANLTVTDSATRGFMTIGDCAEIDPAALRWSNVNFRENASRANLAIIDTSATGSACAYSEADAHLIVDMLGSIAPGSGLGWSLGAATRVLDTRLCGATRCDAPPTARTLVPVELGADIDTAIVNLTVTEAPRGGFATLAPCSAFDDNAVPETSTINVAPDATAANMTIAVNDGSGVCLWSSDEMHLIVDVQTALVDEQEFGFVSSGPSRVYDGRFGG